MIIPSANHFSLPATIPMKLRLRYLWISALLLFLALAGLVYLGTFTRFSADDFCNAGDAVHLGIAGMLARWYTTWTGRFAFIVVTGIFGRGGPKLAGWLPALAGMVWLVGIWWAVLPLIKRSGWPHPRLMAFLAAGLTLLTLFSSIPNLFQSFFWQNGMVNYSLPLIGLTYSSGIILRVWLERTNRLAASLALFVLAFVCGGFTEAFTAMQVTLFALILLISLGLVDRTTRRHLSPVLAAALLGGLIALLVVIIAPGNSVRLVVSGNLGSHLGMLHIITFSFRNMVHIFGKFFLQTPFWAFVSIVPPFLAGMLAPISATYTLPSQPNPPLWKIKWLKGVAFIVGVAMILVAAACAPVVYAMNAYPDDRTIIIPQFVIVAASIFTSAVLGVGLRHVRFLPGPEKSTTVNHVLQVCILSVILIATGISIWQTVKQIPDYRTFAKNWDKRSAIIQQAVLSGQNEVTVDAGITHFALADLSDSPNNWVNSCMANYYQIGQIIGR